MIIAFVLGMPTEYINAITKQIDASYNGHHYLVDCATRKDLPNIEFYFGDAKVVLKRDDYSWKYFVCILCCLLLFIFNFYRFQCPFFVRFSFSI